MGAGIVKTYDPKRVIVTFGGIPITGWADGTFIKVTAHADRFTKKVGADGEVMRARSNDDTHTIDITINQTSLANTALNAIKDIDRLTGLGCRPFSITDLNGVGLMFWPQAWIQKCPDVEHAKDVGTRAWIFDTGQVVQEDVNGTYIS